MSSSSYAHVGPQDASGWATSSDLTSDAHDTMLREPDAELGLGGQPVADAAGASSKHKVATLFHLLFKAAALLMYLFSSLFWDSFIIVFVVCVLLLAFDFWTVKNVTGRLLVGLRWWNEVREDGTNVWIFESKPDHRAVHPSDSFMFWSALYATPAIWFVFGIGALSGLRFQWLLIVAVAIILSGANVVGYWRCQRDAGKKVQSFITSQIIAAAVPQATGSIAV